MGSSEYIAVPVTSSLPTLTANEESEPLKSRRRCLSFFVTPMAIGSIIFLIIRAVGLLMKEHDRPSFSYEWAERMAYAFLALGAAFALSKWTRNLFFTDFFSALQKAGKQVPTATRRSGMISSVLVAAVVAICSAKRVVYDGRAAPANNQTTSSWWEATPSAVVVDGVIEVATAAWAALISAVATAIYISYKEQHSGFTTIMTILWTIVTIGYMASLFITASNVQKEINQTTILLTKNGEQLVASEKTEEDCRNRHDILSRTRLAASHVTLMQCLRLTQWRAQFLMAVPNLIGIPLIIVRLLLASRSGEH